MQVKIKNSERIFDNFFQIDAVDLQFEKFGGGFSDQVRRFNIVRPEAVAVLIYLKDTKKFVLISQFRYAPCSAGQNGWVEEIVAGLVDGEDPIECARRECIEESGYEIDDFEHIASVFSSPGITSEFVHLYIGFCDSSDKKYKGGGLDSEHEDIKIIELSIDEAKQRLLDKKFNDGKTILALQHFFLTYDK